MSYVYDLNVPIYVPEPLMHTCVIMFYILEKT